MTKAILLLLNPYRESADRILSQRNSIVENEANNYRRRVLLSTFLVVAVGVFSRIVPIGFLLWDKYLGDLLYAALFYLAFSLVWSRSSILFKATLTFIYVIAVEFFQLTGIPAQLNQSGNLLIKLFAYFVLGSGFSWWDLLAYLVGILIALLLDRALLTKTHS